jgi:hypothetical protein
MKTVLLYLGLVGLPLLGVLGILQVGRGLTAPPAFGGTWRLAAAASEDGCTLPAAPLHVAQSGWRAQVALGATAVQADVDGRALRTREAVAAHGGPCRGWHVEAEGQGAPVPDALVGRLVPEGCACAPVPFRALRVPGAPEGGH